MRAVLSVPRHGSCRLLWDTISSGTPRAQLDHPLQVGKGFLLHAAADPVDPHAEQLALHELHHHPPVVHADVLAGEHGADVGADHIFAQAQRVRRNMSGWRS